MNCMLFRIEGNKHIHTYIYSANPMLFNVGLSSATLAQDKKPVPVHRSFSEASDWYTRARRRCCNPTAFMSLMYRWSWRVLKMWGNPQPLIAWSGVLVLVTIQTGRPTLSYHLITQTYVWRVNPSTAELFNWNFHPLEVVSRVTSSEWKLTKLTKMTGNDLEILFFD